MKRVNLDEIDIQYTTSGSPVPMYEGEAFTGIAYELGPQNEILNEVMYVNGMEDGLEKIWYSSGHLASMSELKWNRPHGSFQHWHENGLIKSEGTCELGYVVQRREWSCDGDFLQDYHIENHPEKHHALIAERELFQRLSLLPQE
jgi:hypothetical protein